MTDKAKICTLFMNEIGHIAQYFDIPIVPKIDQPIKIEKWDGIWRVDHVEIIYGDTTIVTVVVSSE